MKTYSPKPADITRTWFVLDAGEASFGRLASAAATLLLGKGKPLFAHHIDCGDYVVVINSDKIQITGDKLRSKQYYSHSGFPGGLRSKALSSVRSEEVVRHAIRGMLPDNKLRDQRLMRLKIFSGAEHSHVAQSPAPVSLKREVK